MPFTKHNKYLLLLGILCPPENKLLRHFHASA
jgi:hypothetical protein